MKSSGRLDRWVWERGSLVCTERPGCFRRCLCPSSPPPLYSHCLRLCLRPSICLFVFLSAVLVVVRAWLWSSPGCVPPLRVQYVQSLACQLFLYLLRPVHIIAGWRLMFDRLCSLQMEVQREEEGREEEGDCESVFQVHLRFDMWLYWNNYSLMQQWFVCKKLQLSHTSVV